MTGRFALGLLAGTALLGAAALVGWVVWEAVRMDAAVAPLCHADVDTVPPRRVGLVLGCSPLGPTGGPNLFFLRRIDAAVRLFEAHKVEYLLVSGDNGTRGYDEPTAFVRALIARGVPEARIVPDYAGFRTLDSVVRAREVFGLRDFVVISQRFQIVRALFIARANGIDAVGYDAADVAGPAAFKTHAREILARLRAVLDVRVLGTRPRFGGPPVTIGDPAARS